MADHEKTCAIYLRVSTSGQTTDNQRQPLEAVAAARGWRIVATYEDHGISGAKRRDKRPGLDSMLKDATRGKFNVVMAWSVDRLGRSLPDLLATLQEVESSGCSLYLHQQALDSSTPSGRALFGMLGVFAEFERAMIQERIRAGHVRARAKGVKIGRKPVKRSVEQQVMDMLSSGKGLRETARTTGVSTATVARIRVRNSPDATGAAAA